MGKNFNQFLNVKILIFQIFSMPIRPLASQKSCQPPTELPTSVDQKCYINFTRENKNSTEIVFESINHLNYDTVKFWLELEDLKNSQLKSQKLTKAPQVIPVIHKTLNQQLQ